MRTTAVSTRTKRSSAVVGVIAALTLILFGASPAWAVSYGTVTATATASPTCSSSGKTYTCTITVTNDQSLTSPASDASNAVVPLNGGSPDSRW